MKKFFLSTITFIIIFITGSFAQVVWTNPIFPVATGSVTIYFDATQGNAGLANYTGDVYIFTGVITNLSSGPSDWKHVNMTWGSGDVTYKMTSLGNHIYSYYIADINSFYGVSGTEVIEQLALLFTNNDGSIAGRGTGNTDIFYDVWDGVSLQIKILSPDISPYFVNLNDVVNFITVTSLNSTITLYQNNNYVTQYSNTDSVNYNFTASAYGSTLIKVIADDGNSQVSDSFSYIVNHPVTIAPLPVGTDVGINYINDSTVTLVLVAPNKQNVYAIGDFSNWQVNDSNYMNLTPDGNDWWVTLTHLTPQQEYRYQYLVDGNIYIADPYTDKILDPGNDPYISSSTYPDLIAYPDGQATGNVSIFQTAQPEYMWQDTGYVKPAQANLIIYELLIRDFIGTHDYKTLMDTLNYLKTLGVNAIELMPVTEFSGNSSWGYNPIFCFAPDKYYGPKNDLKAFIDLCHQNGMAVIQDIVLNQADDASPMCQLYWDAPNSQPAADNPWLNQSAPHPFSVFNDFNHESSYTQKYVDDVVKYWVTEYHMDGYRFDLSKGFTQFYSGGNVDLWSQYDQSRINNLERIADQIWNVDPSTYLILEHFAYDNEEQVLSSYSNGFMLWDNVAYSYEQSAMGYSDGSDISRISHVAHGFTQPHAVGYMESHDEERMMYKEVTYGNSNGSYSVKPLDSALNRMKQAACFFFLVPGPKMIYEFEELGYDYSISYGGGNTAPKPIRWDYLQYNPRSLLYKFFSALIILKKQYSVFQTGTIYTDVGNLYKSIRLTDATLQATILGNFDIVTSDVIPYFLNTGKWYEFFTGDSITVSDLYAPISMKPGEYRLYTTIKLQQPDLGNVGINDPGILAGMQLQCFPNPVNEIATLDFYVPESGDVRLELFDLSGKKLKTIASKSFSPGWYTVNVFVNDLQNGIYTCKLSCDGMQKVLKVEVQR